MSNNMAAVNEALEMMNNLFEQGVICTSYANSAEEMEQIEELYCKTKSALVAPARNCDVFRSEDEAKSAFIAYYNETFGLKGSSNEIDIGDLKHNVNDILHDYIQWLFAKAKSETKGEDNGSK